MAHVVGTIGFICVSDDIPSPSSLMLLLSFLLEFDNNDVGCIFFRLTHEGASI